jgi:hypothetical protein
VIGQLKGHEETLLFPAQCTHFFESEVAGLPTSEAYKQASDYRKAWIGDFAAGISKFSQGSVAGFVGRGVE